MNEDEPVYEIPDPELIAQEWDELEAARRVGNTPVDLGLLEETPDPSSVSGEAYGLPSPEAQEELAEARETERQLAEQVETVRDEQSLRIANMAQDGVNHFLVNVEGQELCGSCGTTFPCSAWTGEIDPRNTAESAGLPVPDEDKARAIAELLGVDMDRARQLVLLSTPLNQI